MALHQVIVLFAAVVYTVQVPLVGKLQSSINGNKTKLGTRIINTLSKTPTPSQPTRMFLPKLRGSSETATGMHSKTTKINPQSTRTLTTPKETKKNTSTRFLNNATMAVRATNPDALDKLQGSTDSQRISRISSQGSLSNKTVNSAAVATRVVSKTTKLKHHSKPFPSASLNNATNKSQMGNNSNETEALCCKSKAPTSTELSVIQNSASGIQMSIIQSTASVENSSAVTAVLRSSPVRPPTQISSSGTGVHVISTPSPKEKQLLANRKTANTTQARVINNRKEPNKTSGMTSGRAKNNNANLISVISPKHYKYRYFHPCNTVYTSAMTYKAKNLKCHRWTREELLHRMNCLGTFNHQYLAATIQDAMHFRDLETGRTVNFSRSFVLHRTYGYRLKRDLNINPGETLVGQCHAQKTITESGNLRICPVCSAITRQPLEPRRFPEYINELLCDPQMVSTYLPGIDGFCVQKSFTLDLLQFNGEWELNHELSLEAGYPVYTEKWEPYTQIIRRHCACELLPSSPMITYL